MPRPIPRELPVMSACFPLNDISPPLFKPGQILVLERRLVNGIQPGRCAGWRREGYSALLRGGSGHALQNLPLAQGVVGRFCLLINALHYPIRRRDPPPPHPTTTLFLST